MGFSLEGLEVYRESLAFANGVYEITKSFPREELLGITNQLRRVILFRQKRIKRQKRQVRNKNRDRRML
jgi:hypothetical protein